MVVLTEGQVETLVAFLETFDLRVTGVWPLIEEGMREDFGIDDPETDLEQIRQALMGNA